jgi:ankyrin repeat protein
MNSNIKFDSLNSVLKAVSQTADFSLYPAIDVSSRGIFKDTPLHIAAVWGNIDAGKILLDAGADINAKGENGFTALQEAVQQRNRPFVEFLLTRGASVKIQNDEGQNAMDLAKDIGATELCDLFNRENSSNSQ